MIARDKNVYIIIRNDCHETKDMATSMSKLLVKIDMKMSYETNMFGFGRDKPLKSFHDPMVMTTLILSSNSYDFTFGPIQKV